MTDTTDELGELLGDFATVPSKIARAKMNALIVMTLGLGILALNWFNQIHWIAYLIGGVIGFVGFALLLGLESFTVRIYTGGLAYQVKGKPLLVYPFVSSTIGESQSGDERTTEFDYYLQHNGIKRVHSFGSKHLNCDPNEFRELLHGSAYKVLIPRLKRAIENDEPLEYENIIVKKEGVHFKKADCLVKWGPLTAFRLDEDGKLVFRDDNLKPVATKLWMYEIPYLFPLMKFGGENRTPKACR